MSKKNTLTTDLLKPNKTFLESRIGDFLSGMRLNLSDPNLKETPKRLVKMYTKEFLCNVNKKPKKDMIKTFPNEKAYDEIVLLDNIPFVSLCSHHFLPFSGLAWFAYVPNKNLVGASKPARIIDFFSKKPQLQENLASEVVDYFTKEVHPIGVMLVMRAVHGCMACRGAKTGDNGGMTISITRGCFRENMETRMEALDLIKLSVSLRR
jgi:GTP cyclohydrolase I